MSTQELRAAAAGVAMPRTVRQEMARTTLSLAGWKKPDIARAVVTGYREGAGRRLDLIENVWDWLRR